MPQLQKGGAAVCKPYGSRIVAVIAGLRIGSLYRTLAFLRKVLRKSFIIFRSLRVAEDKSSFIKRLIFGVSGEEEPPSRDKPCAIAWAAVNLNLFSCAYIVHTVFHTLIRLLKIILKKRSGSPA